ncbi:MAG: Gfo/Idh/MocA family oxidoreductase [Kiritimatiellia bacterium]
MCNDNRRTFLRHAAVSAAAAFAGGCGVFQGKRTEALRERDVSSRADPGPPLDFAFIGVGGIGSQHLQSFNRPEINVAALCDVDMRELYKARDMISVRHPSVQIYKDFRVMLQNMPRLDAVVISTPDHGHGVQAVHALRAGCHVFLETPLTHTLEELEVLENEAERAGRIVMPGDCGCMHEEALRAHEVISTGILGKIIQVHIWTNRPVWPQGGSLPAGSDPVPETLDWQLWLSGAKPRSFKRYVYHRFNWRGWTDFGSGTLGDIGCRLLGFPYKVLQLEAPYETERTYASRCSEFSYPRATELRLQCESRLQRDPVEIFWYDGLRMPRPELLKQVRTTLGRVPGTGTLIIGERASWLVRGSACEQHYLGQNGARRMVDLEKHDLWTSAPALFPRNSNPRELFLRSVRNSRNCGFDMFAHSDLNQAILIGAIAQRMDGRLKWNKRKGRFRKNDTADNLTRPHLEPGWKYYRG